MNLQERISAGRSFKYGGRQYDESDVEYYNGKYYIKTKQRTFVKDTEQFERFLDEITLLPEGTAPEIIKKTFIPKPMENKPALNDVQVAQVNTSITAAEKITSKLMEVFNELSGENPTEVTFKKAEAMTKISNAVVSVEQTKINYLKLRNGK